MSTSVGTDSGTNCSRRDDLHPCVISPSTLLLFMLISRQETFEPTVLVSSFPPQSFSCPGLAIRGSNGSLSLGSNYHTETWIFWHKRWTEETRSLSHIQPEKEHVAETCVVGFTQARRSLKWETSACPCTQKAMIFGWQLSVHRVSPAPPGFSELLYLGSDNEPVLWMGTGNE